MVILLKTTSVQVNFIQIIQVRVQNKGKSVWKSRYDGDVSTAPSLNLCLSSSNSVGKLKVKKKNFYECSDPTRMDQVSVLMCHPWISMLTHTVLEGFIIEVNHMYK